jgi:sigma-B regulation protein RsbU (phosphoserine phosphatase)
VSDKAMKGAMTAVMASGMISGEAGHTQSPGHILRHINTALYHKTDQNAFITMSLAVLDTRNRTMTFSSAGQTQPILMRDGKIEYVNAEGVRFPLGVQEHVRYDESTVQLRIGDTVIFYTDGLPEAMNEQQELFDFGRIETSLRKLQFPIRAAEVIETLLAEVENFAGEAKPHDDMTVVVVRVV